MIDYISGTVHKVYEKAATILVAGLGLYCHIPQAAHLSPGDKVELFTYLHWNPEKGPSLYGFHNELERATFLLIIDCPKIGPSIATSILSQLQASQFLEIITAQNAHALSAINGIGPSKAEQLISSLKNKVSKLLASGVVTTQQDFVQWQNVSDVLASLNYTRQEINGAMRYLTDEFKAQNIPLDKLIRAALGFLQKCQ